MNIRGLITVGLVSFCIIAGRASFLLYSAYETARLESQAKLIAQDVNHPSIKFQWIGHTLVLEGLVENYGEKIRAEQIALAYVSQFHLRNLVEPPKIVNALTLSVGTQELAADFPADVSLPGDFE
ncbi:MAG: hypothetical protein V4760_16395 [Bdellovibrionota bacterium]